MIIYLKKTIYLSIILKFEDYLILKNTAKIKLKITV